MAISKIGAFGQGFDWGSDSSDKVKLLVKMASRAGPIVPGECQDFEIGQIAAFRKCALLWEQAAGMLSSSPFAPYGHSVDMTASEYYWNAAKVMISVRLLEGKVAYAKDLSEDDERIQALFHKAIEVLRSSGSSNSPQYSVERNMRRMNILEMQWVYLAQQGRVFAAHAVKNAIVNHGVAMCEQYNALTALDFPYKIYAFNMLDIYLNRVAIWSPEHAETMLGLAQDIRTPGQVPRISAIASSQMPALPSDLAAQARELDQLDSSAHFLSNLG